ncbi:CLUMA_CG009466, isoform B [Clunio marinus]|uniref:CLUMA_CG009466, isoform B n=1 Tax=Clunio marinus TaxID=568069 RepID=A0A1J1I770_9DIPT|nr:CLUMA_CG009466, isoform B [Clunio marinus]
MNLNLCYTTDGLLQFLAPDNKNQTKVEILYNLMDNSNRGQKKCRSGGRGAQRRRRMARKMKLSQQNNDASSPSLRSPKIISRGLKKTLKRLKQKFPGRRSYSTPNPLTLTSANLFQTSDQGPSNVGGRRTNLANISVVRNLQTRLSTVSTVPSEELIWIRDESKNQFSENAVVTSNETIKSLPMDYEVEEGEIIDNDGVENLLQESLVAVRESQKINEATSSSTSFGFYEDRKAGSSGKVPVYETFGTSTNLNESAKSDDVIFVGDVIEETPKEDDSVIFVSEEKRFNEPKSESRGKDRKKKRLLKWKEKKDKEFEALNGPQKNGRSKSKQQKSPIKAPIPKLEQPTTSNEGFQVKAIVPEFRVRFGKSSNYEIMKYLHEHGKLQCTASRAYDDRVLLEAAAKLDAAIVSNDYYRDLVDEKPEYLKIIKTRLIRYNWLFKELFITEDPYGRGGPLLKDILYKNS